MRELTEELSGLAAECATASLWQLGEDDLVAFLTEMHRVQQMAHAAVLHAVREIDGRGIPKAQKAATANVWLRGKLRVSPSEAGRMLRQARLLDADPTLDAAVTRGEVNAEQLTAIAGALGDLPHALDPEIRGQARTALLRWAHQLDPVDLRRLGGRILAHVAPEVYEAAEEARLRDAERTAHEHRYLSVTPTGDGRVRVRGLLDTPSAATVTAALDPLCRPGATTPATHTADAIENGDTRTPGQRRADALVDICRLAMNTGDLPDNGGDRPQLSITAPFDVLHQKLGAGITDTGEPISAATVRKMACDARLLPYVLGARSQILDAGRSRRLVPAPLRRALAVRDRGCTFPACDRPARWCDAHHVISWSDGGPTDLTNLALVCEHHHRILHEDNGWEVRIGSDGHPEYLPPAWLDPTRTPRRNHYHHRP